MPSTLSHGWDEKAHLQRVFRLLVLYRWLSLVPPLIFLFTSASPSQELGALLAAAFSNLLITFIPARLNHLIRRWPALIAVDLVFVAILLALTGGWRSPYYLFALSPLLASAFFFQLRGALIAAGAFTLMFAAAVWVAQAFGGLSPDPLMASLALAGFFLVAGIFGYAATLLTRVREPRPPRAGDHPRSDPIPTKCARSTRGAGACARGRDTRAWI